MTVLLKARETGFTEGLSGLVTLLYAQSFHPHSLRENPSPLTEKGYFLSWKYDRGIISPNALCHLRVISPPLQDQLLEQH